MASCFLLILFLKNTNAYSTAKTTRPAAKPSQVPFDIV
jgi:hypothetical protein